MIIRTEQLAAQDGLLQTGFDTVDSTFGSHEANSAPPASSEKSNIEPPGLHLEPAAKKRWSMFGKLMSFSSTVGPGGTAATDAARRNSTAKDDLAEARRATAAERAGPKTPPKSSHNSDESDASSIGSMPVYEAAQFVFKFTLGSLPWNPNADMTDAASTMLSTLPRERPLSRPRLPAPAQARVCAAAAPTGSGADAPPPPAAGLLTPSGTSENRTISEPRTAAPLVESETESDQETPTGKERQSSDLVFNLPQIKRVASDPDKMAQSLTTSLSKGSTIQPEVPTPQGRENDRQIVHPVKPVGVFKDRATYSGRALAEWAIVVHESNSFFDRRRDEGVSALRHVEVPSLGVENMRRMG